MSLDYISETYGVPARTGVKIIFTNNGQKRNGIITGARNGHLKVMFEGENTPRYLHPTWNVEYKEEK